MRIKLNEIRVEIGGKLYKYYDIGNGDRVLVFLHGLAGSKENQPKFYESLSPDFRCIFLDLPAHNNLPLYGIDSLSGFVDYFISFIDCLNLKRLGLIGFSLGGLIALEISKELFIRGKMVPAVIWSAPINIIRSALSSKASLLINAIGYLPRNIYLLMLRIDIVYKTLRNLRIVLLRHDKDALISFNNISMVNISKVFKEKTGTNFSTPLLFIYGKNDPFVTKSAYDQLKFNNDLHEKLLIERGGHFISQEGKDEGMLHIKDFFDRYLI